MRVQKRCTFAIIASLLVTMMLSDLYVLPARSETIYETQTSKTGKLRPGLWEKVPELKGNDTTASVSLIIWLSENRTITGMPIEDLKNYAVSLFTKRHNATVYYVCYVLPVIMVTVPVGEVERIIAYDFVESVGDADLDFVNPLDVSRKVVGANYVENYYGQNGSQMKIAILDSGINSSHPDVNDLDDDPFTYDPKVIEERSFVDWNKDGVPDVDPMDYFRHGTADAGIVAGTGEASNYQYVGVAPGAWLMNYKITRLNWTEEGEPIGVGRQWNFVTAVDWAMSQGVDVICLNIASFSVGGSGTSDIARAADRAVANGIVVVVPTGNWGYLGNQSISTPGDAKDVITVGAVDDNNTEGINDDIIWPDSGRGPTGDGRPKPEVVAPGVNIISPISQASAIWQTYPEWRVGDSYAELTGTSCAAPHVAGVAALLLQAHPDWTPGIVKSVIMGTARLNDNLIQPTPSRDPENDRGKGIVDAASAISCGFDVPVDDADDVDTNGYGAYHAEAYTYGLYRL